MALRIGALILATCNLLSASVLQSRDYYPIQKHLSVTEHEGDIHSHIYGDHEVLPRPGVIVRNYNIGGSADHHDDESRSERPSTDAHININQDPVDFKPLKYVKNSDANNVKAPITIVTVPRVSTAPPTKHQVVENKVKNQPNLPEYRDYNNNSAKEELLSYDNLLKTAVKPVKEVREIKVQDDSDNKHIQRYPTVKPSKLEAYAEKQIAVGEAREYATPIIRSFTVSAPQEDHHDSKDNILQKDWNLWHEEDKYVKKEADSNDHNYSIDLHAPVITKNVNIAVYHEENSKEPQDWSHGWLGNGKQ